MNIAFLSGLKSIKLYENVLRKCHDDITLLCISEQEALCESRSPCRIDEVLYSLLTGFEADVCIVMGWSFRISRHLLSQFDFYNIHPSLLPKYRGPIPSVFQLLYNERESGVVLHKMISKFDAGPICFQQRFDISSNDTIASFDLKVMRSTVKLLKVFCHAIMQGTGTVFSRSQHGENGSYYSYKDLDLFIVTQNTTYESFKRIHRVLYNSYPVRVMQDGYLQEIETYSEHFQGHFTAFSLQDRIIYIDAKT